MTPKTAVVLTVLNEADSLLSTLHEILAQVSPSTQVIVVDAGSNDGTLEKLRQLERHEPRLQVIVAKGCSRGEGRNIGIRSTDAELVVVTDGGCVPQAGWFDALTRPFSEPYGPDVVGGYWVATYRTAVGKAVACFTTPPPWRIEATRFSPSSRCIAFRRCCFELVGGYPDAQFGEDTAFNARLRAAGCKFMFVPEARVSWPQRERLGEVAKQFFNYGYGSARLGLNPRKRLAKMALLSLWSGLIVLSPWLAVGTGVLIALAVTLDGIRRDCKNPLLAAIVGSTIRISTLAGEAVGSWKRLVALMREVRSHQREMR